MADIFPFISYHDVSEKHNMGNVILFVTQIAVFAHIVFTLFVLNLTWHMKENTLHL